jgi:hypothetical protein
LRNFLRQGKAGVDRGRIDKTPHLFLKPNGGIEKNKFPDRIFPCQARESSTGGCQINLGANYILTPLGSALSGGG